MMGVSSRVGINNGTSDDSIRSEIGTVMASYRLKCQRKLAGLETEKIPSSDNAPLVGRCFECMHDYLQ